MGAAEELAKIGFYFAEGEKLYSRAPDRVVSRDFFALWENFQNPDYFFFDSAEFTLAGKDFTLPEGWEDAEGVCRWSFEHACAVLDISSPDWTMLYLLGFDRGRARAEAGEIVRIEAEDSRKVDLLEAVQFAARNMLDSGGSLDPEKLRKKDFLKMLSALTPELPKKLRMRLSRLSVGEIRALFRKAVADLPEDELGPQMVLPLSGSYAPERASSRDAVVLNGTDKIPERSRGQLLRTLDFLLKCDRLIVENERDFVLTFENAEILGKHSATGLPVISLTTSESIPVYQDDILRMFLIPGSIPFGTFQIDFYDGAQVIGHIVQLADPEADFEKSKEFLNGVLLRSPFELYSKMLENFRSNLDSGKDIPRSAASALLGLISVPWRMPEISEDFGEKVLPLDRSQREAVLAATDPENSVVLVQGPPGTGKTFVLEQLLRKFREEGKRVLIAAPSHAAVDNICRRIPDLPFLRCGKNPDNIASDIRERHWLGDPRNYHRVREESPKQNKSIFFAGTHAALLKESLIEKYRANYGLFDAVVFDESGMAGTDVILLCASLAKRAILFGDHLQLPPFPLSGTVLRALFGAYPRGLQTREYSLLATRSAMEYLADFRKFPVIVLNTSYRCENPRLLRFASTVFYTGNVRPSPESDYYRLPLPEREKKYPASTLQWITTSSLPQKVRSEELRIDSGRPGICNSAEVRLTVELIERLLNRYPLEDITVISPYRRQIHAIRQAFQEKFAEKYPADRLREYASNRINTVDSFQGGENSVIIISYVRSNNGKGIGFTDNPNRVNVAYTRCRRELFIIGDLDSLKAQAKNDIFLRMERAFHRDGKIVDARFESESGESGSVPLNS